MPRNTRSQLLFFLLPGAPFNARASDRSGREARMSFPFVPFGLLQLSWRLVRRVPEELNTVVTASLRPSTSPAMALALPPMAALILNSAPPGGMEVVANSDLFIDGGVNVSNNLNTGIFVNESSVLSSLGGNTINGNFGNAFLMTTLGVSHFYGNDNATGNTLEAFECDTSSVLIDNPDAFAKARCATVKIK